MNDRTKTEKNVPSSRYGRFLSPCHAMVVIYLDLTFRLWRALEPTRPESYFSRKAREKKNRLDGATTRLGVWKIERSFLLYENVQKRAASAHSKNKRCTVIADGVTDG